MIFNKRTSYTDKEKLSMLVESCYTKEEIKNLFIFEALYNEETNTLDLFNISFDKFGMLLEENIEQELLGINKYKNKKKLEPRYVLISGAGSHAGRMKVSLHGVKINNSNKNKYISIYRKHGDEDTYVGKLDNINMDNRELQIYYKLFDRNINLIQYVVKANGANSEKIDKAFINDEKKRRDGYEVIRDSNTGDGEIYLNGKLVEMLKL